MEITLVKYRVSGQVFAHSDSEISEGKQRVQYEKMTTEKRLIVAYSKTKTLKTTQTKELQYASVTFKKIGISPQSVVAVFFEHEQIDFTEKITVFT